MDRPAMSHKGEKTVLLAMGAALLAMLVAAAVFTIDSPGLVKETSGVHASQREQAMASISRLMERLQEDPNDRDALRRLANAFTAMQAWERANTFWRRLVALEEKDLVARQKLAMTYFRMGDHRAAADELKTVLGSDPGNFYARYNLGVLYAHYLEVPDKAAEHFRAITQDPEAPDDLQEEARTHLQDLQQ